MSGNPWEFGWTQLLTLIGLAMTLFISILGLRTFEKWKREKLEERRIEIALDALSMAYQAKDVFESIRRPIVSSHEYEDMPEIPEEADDARGARGEPFAVSRRLEKNKEFFDSISQLQPRVMALFGPEAEDTFEILVRATRTVALSAWLVWAIAATKEVDREKVLAELEDDTSLAQHRANIFWPQLEEEASEKTEDLVGKEIEEFVEEIEKLCRPTVTRHYRR
jgi:hypothetical protein